MSAKASSARLRRLPRLPRPRFRTGELLPTVVQDAFDGSVLMLGHSNQASWRELARTGELVLWSRSRGRLWRKGETSGNTAQVVAAAVDCDQDAILVKVVPRGPICHTGTRSCFGDHLPDEAAQNAPVLHRLEQMVESRRAAAPPGSYTRDLLENEARRLKKVGEEASELMVAAAQRDHRAIVWEGADLLYHMGVLLGASRVRWGELFWELAGREHPSGPVRCPRAKSSRRRAKR